MSNQENKAFNLKELLTIDKYIIPRYQRNYAWGKSEISQLIKDIDGFFEDNPDKNYYVGSLVCFKRENGDYELIDGQQRHTTISLINAVLKNWDCLSEQNPRIENVISETNLKFDSRKNVQRFLEELYQTQNVESYIENSNITGTQNFKDAIGFIREDFYNMEELRLLKFSENFYQKVKFFRVEVPDDTDLNHYFEIMNNRGEQLEKHEIVKANLMSKIKNENYEIEKKEQEIFATIWDSCSDMSNYIHFNFKKGTRESLFPNGTFNSETFDDLIEKIKIESNDEILTLSKIIEDSNYQFSTGFSQEERTIKEKYKSVIDFPNFLLQVLKFEDDNVSLDDKNLLKEFERDIDPKLFIYKLLNYRILFDQYIIKQDLSDSDEEKQNWSIRSLKITSDRNNDFLVKTFDTDDDELIKLQTMLYYSNPSNSNNNWVQKIIKEKYFEQELIIFSEKVLSEIAKPRFKKENLTYPDITAFNLYFIDLLLWKVYKIEDNKVSEDLRPLKQKINNLKSEFNTFKFKQLNSKEHLASQTNAYLNGINNDNLNSIGNLCLISTSQNSQGNKENPLDKKKRYQNDNSSLKRLIMFETFENDKWEAKQIEIHEKEIQTLLRNF